MLPAFPNVTTQIDTTDNNDVDLEDLKSSVLSNKQVMLKWIQTTEKQLEDEIELTKSKILTESKKEINYVDEILKEKLTITADRGRTKDTTRKRCSFVNAGEQVEECRRPNQPHSNYCSEHISTGSDQPSFKQRCSFILSSGQQCPKSPLNQPDDDKEASQLCQRHLKLVKKRNENGEKDKKESKEKASKPKRKYVKQNGTTNENKPRKPRKKKDAASLPNGDHSTGDPASSANGLANQPAVQESSNPQRLNGSSLIDSLAGSDFSKSQQQQQQQRSFTPFVSSTASCYSTDLNESSAAQYGYTTIATADQHGLITADHHYAPCITNAGGLNSNGSLNGNLSTNLSHNLNQLSSLNHSEDSLALAIVGNGDDLASVPFEESELTEMIGKIPEDAFNDIFMENLSTESSELRAIDSIAFSSDNLDNLEPSISNQAFASLNFKSGSNGYFSQVSSDQQNSLMNNGTNLIYSNSDLNGALSLNGGNLNGGGGGGELICISNGLISTSQPIKEMSEHHFAVNGICGTMSNAISGSMPANAAVSSAGDQQPNYNGSFGVLDYKPQPIQPYPSNVIHPSNPVYSAGTNGGSSFNSNYLHVNVPSYSPAMNGHLLSSNNGSDNGTNGLPLNGHSNHLLNGYSNGSLSSSLSNSLSSNLSMSSNLAAPSGLPSSSSGQLPVASQPGGQSGGQPGYDCAPTVKNDDKKFNLFSNCKTNGSVVYQSTYSNIYDDLPAFESNRVNGSSSSLPSFSIMKKNRIESR